MLYRPETFEPLTEERWDEQRVRHRIGAIVAGFDEGFDAEALWPVTDEWDAFRAQTPLTTLYAGSAGVLWALDQLRRRGHAEPQIDLAAAALRSVEAWRESPDFEPRAEAPVHTDASLYFGETGALLAAWRLQPSREVADDLHRRVRENADNETNELMHGAPGTMLVARSMQLWTGEGRWAEAWRESAEVLLQRRDADGLWMYPPYGRGLGASHGVVTNTNVLLQGGELGDPAWRDDLPRDTAAALARTAVLEHGRANWPLAAEDEGIVGFDGEIRVQWCHGAAGVVAGAAAYLDEELLLAGANLVWDAGPPGMEKGPGICHGTAGNGYAFLKVFERTGDELWLERARRFAVHSLGQVERWREQRGRYRYGLWSGDIGAALFAADCLDTRRRVPIVDGIDSL